MNYSRLLGGQWSCMSQKPGFPNTTLLNTFFLFSQLREREKDWKLCSLKNGKDCEHNW